MTTATLPVLPAYAAPVSARLALGVLGLLLLTAVGSWLAIALVRVNGGVAAVCVANGLLTGMLLLNPRASWRWWFAGAAVGQAIARLAHGETWWLALLLVAINLLECAIIATWVRRRTDSLYARPLGRMTRDALLATLVACAVSASLATPLLMGRSGFSLPVTWISWYAAHVTSMAMVATLTVCALQPGIGMFGRPGSRVDYALCLSLLLLACLAVFLSNGFPLLFITYLPLMFLVWRHGFGGMMAGIVVVAGASGLAAAHASGPFALLHDATALSRVLNWQLYMAAGCVLAYSTAVAMAKRRMLERDLQRSGERYRGLAAEAERLARFDTLTGLANRRHFDESLAEAVARAVRNDSALLLLALDLDHFKAINDSLGHAGGDAVLQEFARRLRDSVFDVDLVARLGGDEFVVLVEYTPTAQAGQLIAERVLEAMSAPFVIDGVVKLDVGTSIGIGLDTPGTSAARLMRMADKALYAAKSQGRNTWAMSTD